MRTKIILHGGFTSTENKLNDGFYQEFVRDLSEGATVLLVYFSRRDDELDVVSRQDSERIGAASSRESLKFVVANIENFSEQVEQADAVFIRGGDTDKLMQALEQFPDFAEVIRGKTIAGSSAGAYVFSRYYYSASKGTTHKGLSILPVRVVCHFKSESGKFDYVGDEVLQKINEVGEDLELIVLKDFEWKVFDLEQFK